MRSGSLAAAPHFRPYSKFSDNYTLIMRTTGRYGKGKLNIQVQFCLIDLQAFRSVTMLSEMSHGLMVGISRLAKW
jgi:hypothetical protein